MNKLKKISILTLIIFIINILSYYYFNNKCAPVVSERIEQGFDNAPTLCGAEFILILIGSIFFWIIIAIFILIKKQKIEIENKP